MTEKTMPNPDALSSKSTLMKGALPALCLLLMAAPLAARQVMVKPDDVRRQLSQAGTQPPAGKAASSSAASKASAKPAPAPATTRQSNKATASSPAVSKTQVAQKTAKPDAQSDATVQAAAEHSGPRRDPFEPLVGREKAGPVPENLPPGKAGLEITNLRLDGIVKGPSGMLAVVSSPQQRVYFLRDGDHLYDGDVEHITMEGVSFHQAGTDPFGKAVEREVTKRLFPTPGDEK